MIEFKLPELGDNIDSAEVLKVLVSPGQQVKAEQPVLELETDKATFELPCSDSGRVAQVLVNQGDTVRIGQPVLTLEDAGEAQEQDQPAESGSQTAAQTVLPADQAEAEEAEEADEARQQQGDRQGEPGAPQAPAKDGGQEQGTPPAAAQPARGAASSEVGAGPATRRLARELDVELEEVAAAGGSDHLSQEDIKAYVRQRSQRRQEVPASAPAGKPGDGRLPDFERWGTVERQRLNGIGRTSAGRLTQAWREIPHVTQHEHAEITQLEEARRRYHELRDKADPKITLTALVIKAAIAALKSHPRFNSSYDPRQSEVILKRYYNIGVAVDTPEGLLVPVLHDADKRSIRQLARDLTQLAERARERKLAREELQGASFSISNQGGLGGVLFTPIINPPEVAILGVSATRPELMLDAEGVPRERLLLPLSLSYDHRVNNGADAVRFIRSLARSLEDPFHLLLES